MNWYLDVLKKYAVFDGRAQRKEYWMFVLFNLIIGFILGLIEGIFIGMTNQETQSVSVLGTIYNLAILVPSIAVGVRRMHDTGRSGWWLLLPIVNLVFLIENGQQGENQYGQDPKTNTLPITNGVGFSSASSNQIDKYAQLEKLKKLLDDGVITEEEFKIEKKKIL
jgi:uncharacterized membrane protein YhaH (DUF805 family)